MRKVFGRVLAGVLTLALFSVLPVATASADNPSVVRLSGADRYATAAAISFSSFTPNVGVAFIATGESFPDALAAGPSAAKYSGPVLLSRAGSLPSATATELTRLKPQRIIIIGGPSAVSDTVKGQLAAYTAGAVTRVAGADRYGTAVAVSYVSFVPNTDTVYVATGQNFPDALAGGPAAGSSNAPVLLVPSNGGIPAAVTAEIQRLLPQHIIVLGGESAVSASQLTALQALTPNPVVRRAGADRYATSVAVSAATFPSSATVLLATGKNFPDAIAAGSPAGIASAPVLLSDPSCIPAKVFAEITRLGADKVVILGGPSALSPAVADLTVCATFGNGVQNVGPSGVAPGTYRTRAGAPDCAWARFDGFPGTVDQIITGNASDGPQIVTIKATDALFDSEDCGTWTNDLSPIRANPAAPVGNGIWLVNGDVAAGTWSAPGGPDCYWERDSGFGGEEADVIDNDGEVVNPIITILGSDVGFYTDACGTWTKVG